MQSQKNLTIYNLPEVPVKTTRLFSSKVNKRLNNEHFILKKFKKLSSNPNVRYQENNRMIENKIIEHLLTSINKLHQNSLGSLNSANFLYQIFEKGKNIIENPNKKSQELIIKNCLINKELFKERSNTYCNLPMYSVKNNFISNNESKNYNGFKSLASSLDINALTNFETTQNKIKTKSHINSVKRNEISNKNNMKFDDNFVNKLKIVGRKAKKIIDNDRLEHLGLISKKNYMECQNNRSSSNKKTPSKKKLNLVNKKNKRVEAFDKENLKLFSEKYQKDKKDFNMILFDECINPRRKKVSLENFIKQFSDEHFIEKLYLAQEIK